MAYGLEKGHSVHRDVDNSSHIGSLKRCPNIGEDGASFHLLEIQSGEERMD